MFERMNVPRGSFSRAATVSLFRGNEIAVELTLPPTDSRFVKDDDLFKMALDAALQQENDQRGIKDWDHFAVLRTGLVQRGNRKGERLRINA